MDDGCRTTVDGCRQSVRTRSEGCPPECLPTSVYRHPSSSSPLQEILRLPQQRHEPVIRLARMRVVGRVEIGDDAVAGARVEEHEGAKARLLAGVARQQLVALAAQEEREPERVAGVIVG